jgi:hypothetical protein
VAIFKLPSIYERTQQYQRGAGRVVPRSVTLILGGQRHFSGARSSPPFIEINAYLLDPARDVLLTQS